MEKHQINKEAMKKLAQNIKSLMVIRGLSLKQVSSQTGFSEARLTRLLENKEDMIPLREVHILCDVFDVNVNKMFE